MNLSPLLTSYVAAMNHRNSAAFIALFFPDAEVQDEGHTHQGSAAIQAWIENAWKRYQPVLEPTGVTGEGNNLILTGIISGTFDGSPVELRHHLTLADGKIAALKITA